MAVLRGEHLIRHDVGCALPSRVGTRRAPAKAKPSTWRCSIASCRLANQATNYLAGGMVPTRLGNAHPNIVPYQVFATKDGHLILATSNDKQFRRFAKVAELEAFADDARFATNAARVANASLWWLR